MLDPKIRNHILELLRNQSVRITPSDLKRRIHRNFPLSEEKNIRAMLKHMMAQQELLYTNHFNTSHIELNHNRTVRVSNRIVLAPANGLVQKTSREIAIKLNDGAAFGVGDHPTTRMMLQGIDHVLGHVPAETFNHQKKTLDIGTGSGVLALAAAGLGASKVIAVDNDPMACVEAKRNIRLNNQQDMVVICDDIHDVPKNGGYDLILANLRPPTLKQLFPLMHNLSAKRSIWVLSGFRMVEGFSLLKNLEGQVFSRVWQAETCGWGAMALKVEKRAVKMARHTHFKNP